MHNSQLWFLCTWLNGCYKFACAHLAWSKKLRRVIRDNKVYDVFSAPVINPDYIRRGVALFSNRLTHPNMKQHARILNVKNVSENKKFKFPHDLSRILYAAQKFSNCAQLALVLFVRLEISLDSLAYLLLNAQREWIVVCAHNLFKETFPKAEFINLPTRTQRCRVKIGARDRSLIEFSRFSVLWSLNKYARRVELRGKYYKNFNFIAF